MFVFELDSRFSGTSSKPRTGLRLLQLFARRKQPPRIPHDYREIERVKAELELRRAEAMILSRFKIM